MSPSSAVRTHSQNSRTFKITLALTASLMSSACAQVSGDLAPSLLSSQDSQAGKQDNRSELAKATEYWGKKFGANPKDPKAALAYVKNLKAMGREKQAFAVLQQAIRFNSNDQEIVSEYGRLALKNGQLQAAEKALAHADKAGLADWKVLSARGAVLARQGKVDEAIAKFTEALNASNNNPSVLNNLAMAHVLGGDPQQGEKYLRQAAAIDATNAKVKKNLALVLGLQGHYDEAKKIGGEVQSASTASADTNAIRKLVRLPAKQGLTPTLRQSQVADNPVKWDKLIAEAHAAQNNIQSGAQ